MSRSIFEQRAGCRPRLRAPRLLAAVSVLAWLLPAPGAGRLWAQQPEAARRRPNLVLILSDDQGYRDFGFMGNDVVRTPNLDRLAAASARFVNGYVPTSVCRPSLATLLTGLYPHQHQIHFNHPPHQAYPERREADRLIRAVPALPRVLGEAGYTSLQTGKYWEGHYRNAGFDEGMSLGRPAEIEKEFGLRPAHGNGDAGLAIGRRTMQPLFEFLKRHGDRPFFLWYAPFLPHTPHNVSAADLKLYEGRPGVPAHYARYYASVTRFDRTVGQLMDFLEKKKLAKDTLFVFLVDNGWAPDPARPQRQDRRSKWSPYERGLRTPILIRWDGHVRPGTYRDLASSVDFVPTLLAAAGLEGAIKDLPGVNLLPVAQGKQQLTGRAVFGEIYPNQARALGQPGREVQHRWVRSGRLKLIVPSGGKKKPMLFDVVADPQERKDLSGDPEHKEKLSELRRRLDRWWKPER